MDPQPFWTIFHAIRADERLNHDALLESIGTSRHALEAALEKWKDEDGILVEFQETDAGLTHPRIIGHMRDGKKALLQCVTAAAADADWQSHLPPSG